MKKILTILILLLIVNSKILAQIVINESINTYTNSELIYIPEIPIENTYKITKNTTMQPISNKILEQINIHRRYDVDYLWKVNNNIEILIYYFNKPINIIQLNIK